MQTLRQQWQGAGPVRVVFTNGCYDLLHPGHVDLLSRARMLGDVLVLALNTDDSVRRLGKMPAVPARPVQPLAVRAYMAAHLSMVDVVTYFAQDTPLEVVRLVQPDVLVKGGDWALEQIVGREIVEARGGLVVSLPVLQGYSTTALIRNILGEG
ncbi:MAG: adenylyltransferase/cytidyltransferase family protein [Desulfovibrionaceae bacterium]